MAYPAPIPFMGKPRDARGNVLDWVGLHLAPPDPNLPWEPPSTVWSSREAVAARDATASPQFHPAQTAAPPVLLTAAELQQYNRLGYILRPGGGIPVLNPAEVEGQARLWEACFESHCEGDPQGVNGFFKRYGGCYDLVSHPTVVRLAMDILGPRLACWGAHWMCKPRGDSTATPLGLRPDGSPVHHQDGLGWPFRPVRSTTVWVALDSVREDNGPMVVYDQSHLHGAVDCSSLARVEARFGAGRALYPIHAGHASLHCDMVVHSSPPSTGGALAPRRLAVGIEFIAMDEDAVSDMGSGWGAACFVPGAQVTAKEAAAGFGHLDRPTVYGPPSFQPPGGSNSRL